MVSIITFKSNNPSLSPAEVTNNCCVKFAWKEWNINRPGMPHFFNNAISGFKKVLIREMFNFDAIIYTRVFF